MKYGEQHLKWWGFLGIYVIILKTSVKCFKFKFLIDHVDVKCQRLQDVELLCWSDQQSLHKVYKGK